MSNDPSSGGTGLTEDVTEWLGLFVPVTEAEAPNLDAFMKDENLAEFELRYGKMQLQISDITGYPESYASQAIKDIIEAVKVADEEVKAFTDPIDADKAARRLAALNTLEGKIKPGARALRKHDAEVRKYFQELKKQKNNIQLSESLPKTDPDGDTAWKTEREAYDTQRAQVLTAQNANDYAKANSELKTFIEKMEALIAKKMEALTPEIEDAVGADGSAKKAKQLVDQLWNDPGLITAMTADQQLRLLETLRTKLITCNACGKGMTKDEYEGNGNECTSNKNPACNPAQMEVPMRCRDCGTAAPATPCADCGSADKLIDEWVGEENNRQMLEARAKIFAKMTMDSKFVEEDKENRKAIVKELREDPDFKEAEGNWAQWVQNGELGKIQTLLDRIVAKQCIKLGHDTCPGHNGIPVTVVLTDHNTDPDMDADDCGYCEPGFPTSIKINKLNNAFRDFKEVVDTILHENSHAWQEMIIRKFNAKDPYSAADQAQIQNNENLNIQARFFAENDKTYITSDVSRGAYRHEPLEEHAWTFGGDCAKTLLVPPPVRSFASSKTMTDKTWFLESIKRKNRAVFRTTERHGIYGDEWEGEKAKDKRLILEYRAKDGTKKTEKGIKIREVVDEFTLKTDFDGTLVATPEIDPSKVKAELKQASLQIHNKEFDALSPEEKDAVYNHLVADKNYVKVDSKDTDGTVLEVGFREADTHLDGEVTAARLMLDESVSKIT